MFSLFCCISPITFSVYVLSLSGLLTHIRGKDSCEDISRLTLMYGKLHQLLTALSRERFALESGTELLENLIESGLREEERSEYQKRE
jgi:hypothetical protein